MGKNDQRKLVSQQSALFYKALYSAFEIKKKILSSPKQIKEYQKEPVYASRHHRNLINDAFC
jgi:cell fate (sporulation/competence/biofilm development) regulator YmcA (YheA/YmcA/DUF963 family)